MASEIKGLDKTRQPNGQVTYTDRLTGESTNNYTAQCMHCGMMWNVVPGSGARRGYCYKCPGLLCGSPGCMRDCRPVEQMLEEEEKKEPERELALEQLVDQIEKKFGKLPVIG